MADAHKSLVESVTFVLSLSGTRDSCPAHPRMKAMKLKRGHHFHLLLSHSRMKVMKHERVHQFHLLLSHSRMKVMKRERV